VTRQAITVVKPIEPIIGSWVAAQTTAIASSSHRVCTRLATNPPITAEIENRKKKLDPTSPNCRGVRSNSFIIGTPASPTMGLSLKFNIMNRNNRPTISQALRSSVILVRFPYRLQPRPRAAKSCQQSQRP